MYQVPMIIPPDWDGCGDGQSDFVDRTETCVKVKRDNFGELGEILGPQSLYHTNMKVRTVMDFSDNNEL
jgi:hypothetical protein